MKLSKSISALSIEDSNILKGIGILLIAFHNYFHWIAPTAKENEFDFNAQGISDLFHGIATQPLESINLLFSFWGHYGVQLFIFISGYGLMRAYQNRQIKWFSFLGKRINKLWPAFFFAMVLFYGLMRVYTGAPFFTLPLIKEYLLRLTFVSNFIPGKQFSMNGPWWFYSMIVQLYMIFPLLLAAQKKFGNRALLVISLAAYIVVMLLNPWFVAHNSSLYLFFVANIPVFSLGMMAAAKDEIRYNKFLTPIALVLFILGNLYQSFWYFSHLMFTILALWMIYHLMLKRKQNYFIRVILFYGELSMYFFAVHGMFRTIFLDIARQNYSPLKNILLSIAFIAFSTLAALLLKWIVNKYLHILHYVKNRINQRELPSYLTSGVQLNFQLSLALVLALFIGRIIEYYGSSCHEIDVMLMAMLFSLFYGLNIFLINLLPAILLSRYLRNPALILMTFLFAFILLLDNLLSGYYLHFELLADKSLFLNLASGLSTLSGSLWKLSLPALSFFLVALWFFRKHMRHTNRLLMATLVLISMGTLIFSPRLFPFENQENAGKAYRLETCKTQYFLHDLLHQSPQTKAEYNRIKEALKAVPVSANPNYPFTQILSGASTLEGWLANPDNSRKPNLVIVFVKNLQQYRPANFLISNGRSFMEHLFPQALYWKNNLCTSNNPVEETGSILGSMPIPEEFASYHKADELYCSSLPKLLRKNGYQSFFVGNQKSQINHIDYFKSLYGFDTLVFFNRQDSTTINEFTKGYLSSTPDTALPYCAVFDFSESDDIDKTNTLLTRFFRLWQKRNDYQRTIFVIAGNHSQSRTETTGIHNYRAPLLIYSPLVKNAMQFSSISSNLDIAPSLVRYFEQNYDMIFPKALNYLGGQLSTETTISETPNNYLFLKGGVVKGFVSSNNLFFDDNLYRLDEQLEPKPLEQTTIENHQKHIDKLNLLYSYALTGFAGEYQYEYSPIFKTAHDCVVVNKEEKYVNLYKNDTLNIDFKQLFVRISYDRPKTVLGSNKPLLVIELKKGEEKIDWQAFDLIDEQLCANNRHYLEKTIFINSNKLKNLKLIIYIWNRNDSNFQLDDLSLSIYGKRRK